jgi:DNA-binding NarL/FixJ family response regulator
MAHSALKAEAKATILVVDDHPIFRDGLSQLINRQPDLAVCGEAGNANAAIQVLEARQPNLILMDLRLGTSDVFELIKGWKSRFPELRLLILSAYDEALYAERALRAGAGGYVLKEETPEETISAIRAVLAGEIYVSRKIASCLLHKLIQRKPAVRDARVEVLSDRELQVFRMLGMGLSSRRIGEDLHLSIKTVETHRENIKHKLGIHNASELIRLATQWVQNSAPKDVGVRLNPGSTLEATFSTSQPV